MCEVQAAVTLQLGTTRTCLYVVLICWYTDILFFLVESPSRRNGNRTPDLLIWALTGLYQYRSAVSVSAVPWTGSLIDPSLARLIGSCRLRFPGGALSASMLAVVEGGLESVSALGAVEGAWVLLITGQNLTAKNQQTQTPRVSPCVWASGVILRTVCVTKLI